jgi:quercetin dioxygenase-like cupin family protein
MNNNTFLKISEDDIAVYEPLDHINTFNRRLAGAYNGSQNIEFIIGEMRKGGGAQKHLHTDCDQLMYILEGELQILLPSREETVAPGDLVVFFKGLEHEVHCKSETAKFVVIYSPSR